MQPLLKTTTLLTAGCAFAAIGLTQSAGAATVFEVNTSGNAAALEGDSAGTTTALTLSAADGGGTINVTTIAVTNTSLGMDGSSMGTGNALWGGGQFWTFAFDQEISFDGFGGANSGNTIFAIRSSAWEGADVDDSAEDWSFNDTNGEFTVNVTNFPSVDFTSAGVANVAAGTPITIEHVGGSSGAEMTDFTITPAGSGPIIPTPSAMLLGAVGLGGLALRRRRG